MLSRKSSHNWHIIAALESPVLIISAGDFFMGGFEKYKLHCFMKMNKMVICVQRREEGGREKDLLTVLTSARASRMGAGMHRHFHGEIRMCGLSCKLTR
jgi:hypothetical protein